MNWPLQAVTGTGGALLSAVDGLPAVECGDPCRRFIALLRQATLESQLEPSSPSPSDGASFPCRMPFPNAELRANGRCRPRRMRLRQAERWVNYTFGLFSFWEAGGPQSVPRARELAREISARPLGALRLTWAESLRADVLAFATGSQQPVFARGAKSFVDALKSLDFGCYNYNLESLDVDKLSTVAKKR